MELDHFLLADEVAERADGKIDIFGAGWDAIVATQVPVHHPQIAIVFRVLLSRYEAETEHRIDLVLMSADEELARATGTLPPAPAELLEEWPPGAKQPIASIVNLQDLEFPVYGDYHIAAVWDGTEMRDPLAFRVVPPPDIPGLNGE